MLMTVSDNWNTCLCRVWNTKGTVFKRFHHWLREGILTFWLFVGNIVQSLHRNLSFPPKINKISFSICEFCFSNFLTKCPLTMHCPGISLPSRSNWVVTKSSWERTHRPFLCGPSAWEHPASQWLHRTAFLLLWRPVSDQATNTGGEHRPPHYLVFQTQEAFCFSNYMLSDGL